MVDAILLQIFVYLMNEDRDGVARIQKIVLLRELKNYFYILPVFPAVLDTLPSLTQIDPHRQIIILRNFLRFTYLLEDLTMTNISLHNLGME